ncbi:MAG: phospholipid carrier-dependent glycosyltransferase [Cyanobacteria bacterium P01_F01_bin.116]
MTEKRYMPKPTFATKCADSLSSFFNRHPSWFWLGLIGIFCFGLFFRFWELDRFNEGLIYDEHHYAKMANYYLTATPFLDGHPPLGKYMIVLGIWLSKLNPFGYSVRTVVTEFNFDLPTVSYRWMNALVGACLPLLAAGIAYQLNRRYRYALIAGSLTALDGLLLVESRYALINIYLVTFGLLAQFCFLVALSRPNKKSRKFWLRATGLACGATVSVKWTGLGFLLSLYALWGMVTISNYLWQRRNTSDSAAIANSNTVKLPYLKPLRATSDSDTESTASKHVLTNHPLRQLSQIKWQDISFYLGILPLATYLLIWLPHIHQDPRHGLLGYQKQLYTWHTAMSDLVHRYGAPWYTWPVIGRSRPYHIEKIDLPTDSVTDANSVIYHYVSGMGNPFLWWQSALAVIIITGVAIWAIPKLFSRTGLQQKSSTTNYLGWTTQGTALFVSMGYMSNMLPWAAINRFSIIYHYMPASLFSFLALAWVIDESLGSKVPWKEAMAVISIIWVLFGFFYWLPLYWGLPLTPDDLERLVWFKTWSW